MEDAAQEDVPIPQKSQQTPILTRGYQQELLEESKRRNIIIALDTGAGKTHIAILRMRYELEKEHTKAIWFLAPNVALCTQQCNVIKSASVGTVALVHGSLQPEQWKNPQLWKSLVDTHRVIVSTPQVLLDALRHGYLNLDRIALLCFDEAHHTVEKDPYNCIMSEFYHPRKATGQSIPHILGLTASPMFGGQDVERSFRTMEQNLDCVIRTTYMYRDELAAYVHRPTFKQLSYPPVHPKGPLFSTNLAAAHYIVNRTSIEEDPCVLDLRRKLGQPNHSDPAARLRLDRQLSKAIQKKDTYTQESLRRLVTTAEQVLETIGAWAADWFVHEAITQAKANSAPFDNAISTFQSREKQYLLDKLSSIITSPTSYYHYDISSDCQPKVDLLIDCLLEEKRQTEELNEAYSGLVFVQRRDCVYALTEVLKHHPRTKDIFRVGCLVGASESAYRRSLDITRGFQRKSKGDSDTLGQFRIGELNLIVATAVAEEGIDVQACGSVIRWDPPPTMVSYTQSRGRARKQRSSFTLLVQEGLENDKDLVHWQEMERQMMEFYRQAREAPSKAVYDNGAEVEEGGSNVAELRSAETGALLSLASAATHLNHFCDVIPGASHYTTYRPIYEFDPPDLPEGWHSFETRIDPPPQRGPFGCTVTLPRLLPPHLRIFTTPTEHRSKISAYRHVAFNAYKALYEEGLLNEHFLPLTSVIEPELEGEIKAMLQDVEARAGTSNVAVQMDPWTPSPDEENLWWYSLIEIDDLPGIQLLTKVKPESWKEDAAPIIYRHGRQPAPMTLRVMNCLTPDDELVETATLYTRKLFYSLFGSRMDWDRLNFNYLILPSRREDMEYDWIQELEETLPEDAAGGEACAVPLSTESFDFSPDIDDIALVEKYGKLYRFDEWKEDDEFTDEELTQLEYRELAVGQAIELPVLQVTPLPPRRYFTVPLIETDLPKTIPVRRFLIRDRTNVVLLSKGEVDCGLLLPTVLRCVAVANTVKAFKDSILSGTGLEHIPLKLLTTSLLAPAAGEQENYQRLETLGDTVLKFVVAIQLLDQYPLWHEGYLTRKKDHAVNNARLAKEAIRLNLFKFIIRDRFIGKKWKPSYFSSSLSVTAAPQKADEDIVEEQVGKKKKKQRTEQLSVKLLADTVESLIGAAYLHGEFELAICATKLFDLGLQWKPLSDRVKSILTRIETAEFRLTAASAPPQVGYVEDMIGYKFKLPELLLEALTHASHHPVEDFHGISYERMEYLGDAVLDMIVTDFLYHAPGLPSGKRYTPGHIHLRKSAMVNIHFLGYICLRQFCEVETKTPTIINEPSRHSMFGVATQKQQIWLYQCLLHSSPIILEEQRDAFARYTRGKEELDRALHPSHFDPEEDGADVFPWGELTRLQAPKFLSDMIESILGAVYLDSRGDMNVVKGVLQKLGWFNILERVVTFHMDVLHPVSRVALWAAANKKKEDGKSHHKPEYKTFEKGGDVVCTLSIEEEVIAEVSERNHGKASKEQVRFLAAERAMKILKIRGVKSR